MKTPYAACQCWPTSGGELSRLGAWMGAADVVRWLRENTTPRVPSTTTIVTNAGQKYERDARARRGPQRRVGALAHRSLDPGEQHPPSEGHAYQGQEKASTTDRGAPAEPPQRAVVGEDHPVGRLLARDPDGVHHPCPGLVGDAAAALTSPPAEIDVLDVHEVALVEAAE